MNNRGIILSFEGGEGSGKSTIIKELAKHLEKEGRKVKVVREPGGSKVAEQIRETLLNNEEMKDITGESELLMFLASRIQLLKDVTIHEINEGTIVIYDRYIDSSIVYQGIVKGVGIEKVIDVHKLMMPDWFPDYSILLDVDVEIGLKRATGYGVETNRFEDLDKEFHEKVNKSYRNLFNRYIEERPNNFGIINANDKKDVVLRNVIDTVEKFINE